MAAPRSDVAALRARPHADVLVVGGGINGLATFRDLALQGVDVALVERSDFVSGASSASSHMVHGGIRYLENGEFRLVKEAVLERNRLLRTAPHYVLPLRTTIPIFSTFAGIVAAPFRFLIDHGRGRHHERGAVLIKLGLTIYDVFSRDNGAVPRHRFRLRRASLREFPQLNPGVKYTATYYDASMHDPERIALDVLRDGQRAGGDRARAANYVSAVGAEDGAVRLRDEVTGDEFRFAPRVIVNASGPWTDETDAALGAPSQWMGGTKGSHIVVDDDELLAATRGREIFFEHSDGRIVLVYPLKGRVLIGTTDLDADIGDPVVCTDEEIDYFVDLLAHVFPAIRFDRSRIVYTFAGIRPLPRHDDTAPGFVSRDYRVERSDAAGVPLLSLVGGKWTTFRASAEHLADLALAELGAPRQLSTATVPIGGGAGFPRDRDGFRAWVRAHAGAHGEDVAARLLTRYGTRASEVLAAVPAGEALLPHTPGHYSAAEIAHLARTEQVVHLVDVLLRRTSLAFRGGLTAQTLDEVAAAVGDALGWDGQRRAAEVEAATAELRTAHRVQVAAAGDRVQLADGVQLADRVRA